jgi:hypothetical protein
MDLVDETLREWRRTPFVYGASDCMLSVLTYLARAGAKDTTPLYAGRYSDHAGALAMMAAHGGASGLIAATGAVPVSGDPIRGDVLELPYGTEIIGGVCTGGMVAVRLDRGVKEFALRFVSWQGVWRFG